MAETDEQLSESGQQEEINLEQSRLEEEAIYANELALERQQEDSITTAIQREALSFGKASLFKYLIILLIFAIPNDVIDAIDVTGVGIVVSWLISFFLSMATILVIWFADSELQRVKSHLSRVDSHKKTLIGKLTKISSKLTKYAPKNPVVKVIVGSILEMIPIVSILPWSSISVVLAYLDERKAFKEARESANELTSISPDMAEVV